MSDEPKSKNIGLVLLAILFAILAFLLSMGLGLNAWLVAFWTVLFLIGGALLGSELDDRIAEKHRIKKWRGKTECHR